MALLNEFNQITIHGSSMEETIEPIPQEPFWLDPTIERSCPSFSLLPQLDRLYNFWPNSPIVPDKDLRPGASTRTIQYRSKEKSVTRSLNLIIQALNNTVLIGDNLFMKRVDLRNLTIPGRFTIGLPSDKKLLAEKRDREIYLEEVKYEIIVGHALSRLILMHQLTTGFTLLIDWFQGPKFASSRLEKDAKVTKLFCDRPLHQDHVYIIYEKCQWTFANHIGSRIDNYYRYEKRQPGDFSNPETPQEIFNMLRAGLAQICHGLAIAWQAGRFSHNDLHVKNVMFTNTRYISKDVEPWIVDTSDYLYRIDVNENQEAMFLIPHRHTKSRLVKIIDFGRSHIVPAGDQQERAGLQVVSLGIDPTWENKYYDLRILMFSVLTSAFSSKYWHFLLSKVNSEDALAFKRFIVRAIDMETIREILKNDWTEVQKRTLELLGLSSSKNTKATMETMIRLQSLQQDWINVIFVDSDNISLLDALAGIMYDLTQSKHIQRWHRQRMQNLPISISTALEKELFQHAIYDTVYYGAILRHDSYVGTRNSNIPGIRTQARKIPPPVDYVYGWTPLKALLQSDLLSYYLITPEKLEAQQERQSSILNMNSTCRQVGLNPIHYH